MESLERWLIGGMFSVIVGLGGTLYHNIDAKVSANTAKIEKHDEQDTELSVQVGKLETKVDDVKEGMKRIENTVESTGNKVDAIVQTMSRDSRQYAELLRQYQETLALFREGRK
jgi:septal ring factor EnvC (AmiA/AmiB activator)